MSHKLTLKVDMVKQAWIRTLVLLSLCTVSSAGVCQSDCSHQIGASCSVSTKFCDEIPSASSPDRIPSEPGGLVLEYFSKNGTRGLNVSWFLPDDSSVAYLQGFDVELLATNQNRQCFRIRIPDICAANPQATAPLRMFLDCFSGIEDDTEYHIWVTSLPISGPHRKVAHAVINIPKTGEAGKECSWLPQVTLQQLGDTLQVTAQLAPPEFPRKIYWFDFYKCNTEECGINYLVKVGEKKLKPVDSPVTVTFSQVQKGYYLLKVDLRCDEFDNKCHVTCKNTVSSLYFKPINVTDPSEGHRHRRGARSAGAICTSDLTRAKESTTNTSLPGSSTPGSNTGLVVGLTLSVILLASVAVALLVFFMCHYNSNNNDDRTKYGSVWYRILSGFSSKGQTTPPGDPDTPVSPPRPRVPSHQSNQETERKQRPVVMVINSYDFPAHEECVLALARFLHNHANCEVKHYRFGHDAAANKFHWICTEMEKATKVIIIHSQGSKLQYYNQEDTSSLDAPPEGDIFKRAFTHIISKYCIKNQDHRRFLNARFSYSPYDCVIDDIFGQANSYVLMKHIPDLVAIIHDVPLNSQEGSLVGEIIHPDRYDSVPYGSDLKACINKAAQYIKERPQLYMESARNEDSGNISMSSKRSSSNFGFNQTPIVKTPQSGCKDMYGYLESPTKSLTEASELFEVNFPQTATQRAYDEHDEVFIPPQFEADSEDEEETAEEANGQISTEFNSRLWDLNRQSSI